MIVYLAISKSFMSRLGGLIYALFPEGMKWS